MMHLLRSSLVGSFYQFVCRALVFGPRPANSVNTQLRRMSGRNPATVALGGILAAVLLTSCSQSDESLARSIQSAQKASDVFVSLCYKTSGDVARARHIATLLNWSATTNLPAASAGTLLGAWQVMVDGHQSILFIGQGPDDRKGSATTGRPMNICGIEYFGDAQPSFVQDVVSAVDLKRVDPANYLTKRPDDAVILSQTGLEDSSLQMTLAQTNAFLLGRMTLGIVMKVN